MSNEIIADIAEMEYATLDSDEIYMTCIEALYNKYVDVDESELHEIYRELEERLRDA